MANLIRLKQIESGSYLNTAATIGQDFSQSVIDIIVGEVAAALPDGVISSSIQVDITQTTNFVEFSSSISISIDESNIIFNEFSTSVQSQISASLVNATSISESVNSRLIHLELFSSSLDNGFATDAELTLTSSQIIDQGEF